MEKIFGELKKIINEANALLITSGAGMGVDSGLPDFRGPEGFWNTYPALKQFNLHFEQMANPRWFDQKPKMAWAFYGHRYNLYKNTKPHKGFDILLKWAKQKKENYFVVTSNVDGHFQKAGFNNSQIYEIHGSINHLQCTKPCSDNIWKPDFDYINIDENLFEAVEPLPVCPNCGAIARPNILMFGDWSWIAERTNRQEDNFNRWLMYNRNSNIVVIELGAGTAIPTIRLTSEDIVNQHDAKLIRINPREHSVPYGHYSLQMTALKALEAIDNADENKLLS